LGTANVDNLGKTIRRARHARGMTQAQVAEQIQVSVEFFARIERGIALPSVTNFAKIVNVLDVRADVLLEVVEFDDDT
jgi:transcriptional regulator with XRE-family HTH domain